MHYLNAAQLPFHFFSFFSINSIQISRASASFKIDFSANNMPVGDKVHRFPLFSNTIFLGITGLYSQPL